MIHFAILSRIITESSHCKTISVDYISGLNVGQSKQIHLATLLTDLITRVSRGENVASNFKIMAMLSTIRLSSYTCD